MCTCTSWMRHRTRVYPSSAISLSKSATADLDAQAPESILPAVVMDSGLARSLSSGRALRGPVGAPRNDQQLFLLRHLLRRLPEHIPSRLLVERLFFEFADRKPRLHLRPRAHLRIPALDVRIIVERKALRLVGHGPGKAGDVGNRIVAGDVSPGLAQLPVAHAIQPCRLVAVAFDC